MTLPILRVIENMAWFESSDGKTYHIFGKDGGVKKAEFFNFPLLGKIPIYSRVRKSGDSGPPITIVSTENNKGFAVPFHQVAARVFKELQ